MQQALLLGALGYGLAYGIGLWVFPLFPGAWPSPARIWCSLRLLFSRSPSSPASLGIWKAMSIQPNEILS